MTKGKRMKKTTAPQHPLNPETYSLEIELDRVLTGAPTEGIPAGPTMPEFLNALRERLRLPSDYALAKHLEVTQKTVKTWRSGRGGFSDQMAMRVEDELKLPRGYVVACMHAWREPAESTTQQLWFYMAKLSSKAAASVMLGAAAFIGHIPEARAAGNPTMLAHSPAEAGFRGMYIM